LFLDFAGKNQVVGDILVLCGSIMYGVSNVAQEFVVKNFSRAEFLGMIGLFGSFISAIQMYVFHFVGTTLMFPCNKTKLQIVKLMSHNLITCIVIIIYFATFGCILAVDPEAQALCMFCFLTSIYFVPNKTIGI